MNTASAYADGVGPAAWFHGVYGIAFDGTSVWIADRNNHRIRRVSQGPGPLPPGSPFANTSLALQSSLVTTFAGSGDVERVDGIGEDASFATGRPFAQVRELYVSPELMPLFSGDVLISSALLRQNR